MGEPKHKDILLELKEVEIKDYHQLGICLDIDTVVLGRIEHDSQHNTKQQLANIISYWQRNNEDHSWGALATALENVGGYKMLVRKLRNLDGLSKTKGKNTTEPTDTQTTTDNQTRDTPTNNETTDTLSPREASGMEARLGYLETGLLVGGSMLAGAILYEGVSAYQNRKRERESETEDTDENSSKPKEKQPKKT